MNRWLTLSVTLTALAVGASLCIWFGYYDRLPERLPIHWNISGDPDSFVPRADALLYLLLAPAVMAGFVLLTLALPWLSPKRFEVERFRTVYNYVMALVVALFAYMH